MTRSSGRRRPPSATLAVAILSALLAAISTPSAFAAIDWHGSLAETLEAAGESGKPILVFIYLGDQAQGTSGERRHISVRRQGEPPAGEQLDLVHMLKQTLTDPEVVAAARDFEALKLDLCDPRTDQARVALKVGPGVDTSTQTRVGMYPITVFLDPSGEELFRRHGCMPALGYAAQLEQAHQLFERREAALADPQDAVTRRNLGRAYMEMDPTPEDRIYQAAVENLQAAIRLDPTNEAGANFDARVDLAILAIPRNQEQAVTDLFRLQTEDADGHRKLEIQYYMAVAHFVMGDFASAKQLLREFETDDHKSPYWDSPWTPQALGLLQYIKQIGR